MFHLPSTPRNNSSNFEWTIDDVSHLRPANVQVDESQFLITQDPTLEAEVQEAIKTFFNETDIGKEITTLYFFIPKPNDILKPIYFLSSLVPSPVERNSVHQRRVLFNEEESVDSNVLGTQSEIKTRMRDSSSQTILSLPPNLPKEVLDVLKPYFSFNDVCIQLQLFTLKFKSIGTSFFFIQSKRINKQKFEIRMLKEKSLI